MTIVIGMDEAGLGPNLGPFVVAATVWHVPGFPDEFDLWSTFAPVLTHSPNSCDPRLHVADSKQVFQPGRGIGSLERGVWSSLKLCGIKADSFRSLCAALSPDGASVITNESSVSGAALAAGSPHENPTAASAGPLTKENPTAARAGPLTKGRGEVRTTLVQRSLFDEPDFEPTAFNEAVVTQSPPWYSADGLSLPVESADETFVEPWRSLCEATGVRLVAIRADVVEPIRFNQLVRQYDNKSAATSRIAMNVLRSVWRPQLEEPAFVVADKHGGRNRYEPLLAEAFPEATVTTLEEGAECSDYRIAKANIRFQPRAEEHLPVALASMTAKYLREMAMHQFNAFWKSHLPQLKPTQGYPLDAKRFRAEIASTQQSLNIPDDVLWRER